MSSKSTASDSRRVPRRTGQVERAERGSSMRSSDSKAKEKPASSRRSCAVERVRTPKPKASGLQDPRQAWRIRDDRTLLRLARFPEQEPGVTLEYLLEQTNRSSIQSVWESALALTAIEYFEEVTLSDGSTGFALTELAVEREKLLPADQLTLVRLPSAATVMRLDQLIALSGRSEDEVRADLATLARRGFLERGQNGSAKGLVWPTLMGLQEAGFPRAYYPTPPRSRNWPHALKVNDVHLALIDEFVPRDKDGNREWGAWQWVSERMRSRRFSRNEEHLADGFLFNGKEFSVAVEVARSAPVADRLLIGMEELSRDHSEVRYYSSNTQARNKIARAMQKMQLPNVKLLEMPGEVSS
jgi:hypothetical protein